MNAKTTPDDVKVGEWFTLGDHNSAWMRTKESFVSIYGATDDGTILSECSNLKILGTADSDEFVEWFNNG